MAKGAAHRSEATAAARLCLQAADSARGAAAASKQGPATKEPASFSTGRRGSCEAGEHGRGEWTEEGGRMAGLESEKRG